MSIELWQNVGYVCGGISALILVVGLIRQKVVKPVLETARQIAELVRQLVGDQEAHPPRPSLMQLVADVRTRQEEQAAEQARIAQVVAHLRAAHDEHINRDHRGRNGLPHRDRR